MHGFVLTLVIFGCQWVSGSEDPYFTGINLAIKWYVTSMPEDPQLDTTFIHETDGRAKGTGTLFHLPNSGTHPNPEA